MCNSHVTYFYRKATLLYSGLTARLGHHNHKHGIWVTTVTIRVKYWSRLKILTLSDLSYSSQLILEIEALEETNPFSTSVHPKLSICPFQATLFLSVLCLLH